MKANVVYIRGKQVCKDGLAFHTQPPRESITHLKVGKLGHVRSRGHTTRTPWGCTKGFCTAVDIPNDSWTILALLEKFGCQWWIGTCDGVAFNDSSEFGHYLMCYKKVGRVYLECRVHWGYKAVTAEAHNQILSELNAFLLLLQTARKKNVKYLIIRSDSESAVDIVTTIWKKDSVNFATRKQKAGFPSLLRMIHKEMRFLWNFVCIHIHKDNNLLANAISRLPTHMKYLQPPIDARKVKRADPLCEVNFEGMLFEKLHMVFCEQR
ncbi:hypothetical protein FRX31_005276 [Thalictrum thalictroides]|uniref:RNase H type-1 domain-containing protein n=1 Tax=Thalictrum thalictroides TaxID=46969 RepID=A0A7J6X643_THATH|nr:hypothetical protein FRX31_005276 [Thalictrum thalictroides]